MTMISSLSSVADDFPRDEDFNIVETVDALVVESRISLLNIVRAETVESHHFPVSILDNNRATHSLDNLDNLSNLSNLNNNNCSKTICSKNNCSESTERDNESPQQQTKSVAEFGPAEEEDFFSRSTDWAVVSSPFASPATSRMRSMTHSEAMSETLRKVPVAPISMFSADDSYLTSSRKTVWNSNIDWSRSTVELSSDEESLPSSASSTDISQLSFHEDDLGITADFRRQSQWEMLSPNPYIIPPFRSRAHTVDGTPSPLRRHSLNQQRRNHAQTFTTEIEDIPRGRVPSTDDFTPSLAIHVYPKHWNPSGRCLLFLFLIATYTTFLFPYPEVPIMDHSRDKETSSYISSVTSGSTSVDGTGPVIVDSATTNVNNLANTTFTSLLDGESESAGPRQVTRSSGLRGSGTASFARRNNNLKKFRSDEMAKFYQQKAIQQHNRSSWVPWYVNIGILCSVALLAAGEWIRARRSIRTETII